MRKGFTLIELLLVITILSIMVGVYFMAGNPAGQLAASRNTRRSLDLQTILSAVRSNIYDQSSGQFACGPGPLPTSSMRMASASTTGNYDIGPCLIPVYLHALPFDPSASSSYFNSGTDYDTGYTISINASGTVILTAPNAELDKTIQLQG